MQKVLTIVSFVVLASSSAVRAQDEDTEFATAPAGTPTPVSHFTSADRDADGKISVEEFRNRMTKVFFELDADGDGLLQEDELSAVLLAPHQEMADADGSKTLSHREFIGHTIFLFDSVDGDGDGHFTAEELAAAGGEEVKP